jgi:hypothetical protein
LQGQFVGEDLPKTNWHNNYLDAFTGLSEGRHGVKVDVTGVDNYYYVEISSGIISFTVDTVSPTIKLWQASEKTYGTTDVPLNFTVNEPASWIGYSLDGKKMVTITDTVILTRSLGRDNYCIVLSGLSAGSHSVVVYAKDAAGNTGESEALNFTIAMEAQPETEQSEPELQPSNPEPFPATLVVASIASVAVVSLGLLVYFKKRRS